MKPIKIANEYGETIEIKYDAEGAIKIRHSDVDPKRWGELHEYSKRMRHPAIQQIFEERLAKEGMDPNINAAQIAAALDQQGAYMVIQGKSYIINAKELAMIHEAIKQAGGIIPNWSNRP